MEALIILLGALVAAPVVLGLILEGIAVLISIGALLLEMFFGIVLERRSNSQSIPPEVLAARREKATRRFRWLKRCAIGLAALFLVSAIAAAVLNFFFFESALRFGLARISKRTGIEIKFESASGNLFAGRYGLNKVSMVRRQSTTSTFDLRADQFLVDVSMLSVYPFKARIERVYLKGLKGEFRRLAPPDQVKLRKDYEVDHLRIEDADIKLHDDTRSDDFGIQMAIDELELKPMRSQYAIFDLLFRSNVSGQIDGRPFAIRTTNLPDFSRQTEWEATGLPVTFLNHYLGGPFRWLEAGTADVHVYDRWKLSRNPEIEMQWHFALKDLAVQNQTNSAAVNRFIATAVQDYFRHNTNRLDVDFNLTVNENQFKGAASTGAAGLLDAVKRGFTREVATRCGVSEEQVEHGVQRGMNAIKGFLDRRKDQESRSDPGN